jgi:hypothetical protein
MGRQSFPKPGNNVKFVGARRMTGSQLHTHGPQNVRRHRTKFCRQGYLAPALFAPQRLCTVLAVEVLCLCEDVSMFNFIFPPFFNI